MTTLEQIEYEARKAIEEARQLLLLVAIHRAFERAPKHEF